MTLCPSGLSASAEEQQLYLSVFLSFSTSSTTKWLNELKVVISPPGSGLKITGLTGRMSAFPSPFCLENVYLCMMCACV